MKFKEGQRVYFGKAGTRAWLVVGAIKDGGKFRYIIVGKFGSRRSVSPSQIRRIPSRDLERLQSC